MFIYLFKNLYFILDILKNMDLSNNVNVTKIMFYILEKCIVRDDSSADFIVNNKLCDIIFWFQIIVYGNQMK